jgi:hypothetical protein
MLQNLLQSSENYKSFFANKLSDLIISDQIGVFILVLANATAKPEIFHQLSRQLQIRFDEWILILGNADKQYLNKIPADDVKVFQQLQKIGFQNLELTSHKQLGAWKLQYNQLRSLRPPRNSQRKISEIHQPFDSDSFHFNKSFLSKEVLWQGSLEKNKLRILYNKFPFADYHSILLLQPEQNKPQFLTQHDCAEIQQLLHLLSGLTGLGLAYNSLGAFASINHQHWQMFISEKPYPVELEQWSHNSGQTNYPITVVKFNSPLEAWAQIDENQRNNNAFNLFIRPGKTYLVARNWQGTYQHAEWTSGFAWSELMGNITVSRKKDYASLNLSTLEQEFKNARFKA